MPATNATSGYGCSLYIGDGNVSEAFTKIAEVESITPPDVNLGTADATHMESPDRFMEDIGTLLSTGEATANLNFLPTDTTQQLLATAQLNVRRTNFRIVLPAGNRRFEFTAFVTKIGRALPKDDRMTMTVTLKGTGKSQVVAHP